MSVVAMANFSRGSFVNYGFQYNGRMMNNTILLKITPTKQWFALSGGWAVIAAALATRPATIDTGWILRMVLLWLLVDSLLGTVWHLMVTRNLRKILQLGADMPVAAVLPFTVRHSAAYKFGIWREKLRTHADGIWQPLVVAVVLALAIAGWLGWAAILLALVALGTAWAFSLNDRVDAAAHGWLSLAMFFLPFAVAANLTEVWRWDVALLGASYAVVYFGLLRLRENSARAEIWVVLGLVAAAVLMFAAVQPLAGGIVALGSVSVLLVRPLSVEHLLPLHAVALIGLLMAAFALGGGG